jgi:hypothetical protein
VKRGNTMEIHPHDCLDLLYNNIANFGKRILLKNNLLKTAF